MAPSDHFHPSKASIALRVNGEPVEVSFAPYKTLLEVLREDLQLTGTKHGCELGECGACAVLVDGRPVLSCLVLGLECQGRAVETIEGMASATGLHPLQKAFAELGAAQCGYCTPGFLLTARALLDANPSPSFRQIQESLAGNICRCTGYIKIFEAVELAAARLRGEAAVPRRETLYGTDFDESGLLPVWQPGSRATNGSETAAVLRGQLDREPGIVEPERSDQGERDGRGTPRSTPPGTAR